MSSMKSKVLPAAVLVLLAEPGIAWAQSPTISFAVPGPADWNDEINWDIGDVPGSAGGDPFPQDVAGVSGDRTAFLESPALFPVDGVILGVDTVPGVGTLEIRAGGALTVTNGGGDLLGTVLVGQGGGTGILDVQGVLNANALELGGAAGSQLRVGGSGVVAIAGDVNLMSTTVLNGPDFTFDVDGELFLDGIFTYQITGTTGGTLNVPGGNAALDGTLVIEMPGHTPEVGQSWTVINADSLSGGFANIQVPATPLGIGVNVLADAATGDVTVEVGSRLVLTVDRRTGAATISNIFVGVDFDGYSISSPAGRLDVGAWSSLDQQGLDGGNWNEANPSSNNLNELNLLGQSSLGAGGSIAMGNLYDNTAIALNVPVPEDLTFEYSTPNGQRLTGAVVFEGPMRPVTLELVVDRATGGLSIRNQTGLTADMDGYVISSAVGRLDSNGWNSLDAQMTDGGNWNEAATTSNNLAELNLLGMTNVADGSAISIGDGWDNSVSAFGETVPEDLAFEFTTADGRRLPGVITYEGLQENNLFLSINPATGAATIQNRSGFEVDMDGYTISSVSGSLDPDAWNSLDEQMLDGGNWSEASPTPEDLSELNLLGMTTLSPDGMLDLGSPFVGAGGEQDITFHFSLIGLGEFDGIVVYAEIGFLTGDTNADGTVDINDLNNVRNNFGAMGDPDGSLTGDAFPFDGIVNIDDLNAVRNNFGAMLPAPVPEPGGILLCSLGLVGILNSVQRRRRSGR